MSKVEKQKQIMMIQFAKEKERQQLLKQIEQKQKKAAKIQTT